MRHVYLAVPRAASSPPLRKKKAAEDRYYIHTQGCTFNEASADLQDYDDGLGCETVHKNALI